MEVLFKNNWKLADSFVEMKNKNKQTKTSEHGEPRWEGRGGGVSL